MKRELRMAGLILVLSGAAALGHQLLWTRRMTDLLGAGTQASARVIGCYFLGIAMGAALTARIIPRVRNLWRGAAYAECGAAILSVPILLLPSISDWLWPMVGVDRFLSGEVVILRWVLSVAVVVPPAMAVGASLPLIIGAVQRSKPDIAGAMWLYTAYTAGSAAGLAIVASVLLQSVGAAGSMVGMILLNLTAAILCWKQGAAVVDPGPSPADRRRVAASASAAPGLAFLLAAFFSGAGIIATEVPAIELVNLITPLAFYPQAAVLFSAVVLLAVAAALAAKFFPRFQDRPRFIPWILGLAGILVGAAPLLFVHGIATKVSVGYSDTIAGFALQMFSAGVLTLGGGLLVGGLLFPLLVLETSPDQPARVAWLLAINGLGGVIGAEFALRVLLPIQGVHIALGLVGCLYSVAAILWTLGHARGSMRPVLVGLGALACCVYWVRGPLSELRVFIDAPNFRVLEVTSSRDGSLAIVEREGMGRGMIYNNQYLLGASGAGPDMARQTHVPLLLHRHPKRVAFLGLGTGITASAALQHPSIESITAVEISPAVARASEIYFSELNGSFSRNSKVRVLVDDARTFTVAATNQFDVIIGDLFTPWRPGEARLCALEQFAAAKRALRGDGVFCQWIPMHQLTRDQFEVIANTFRSVFPETHLFRNHFRDRSVPVALVGFARGPMDWGVVSERAAECLKGGHVRDPLCRHVEGIAMLYLGRFAPGLAEGSINTLANLRVELDSGYNLILKLKKPFLTGHSPEWTRLIESQIEQLQSAEDFPAPFRPLPALGLEVTAFDRAARENDPSTEALRAKLLNSLPASVRADTAADWGLWSGDASP